MTARNDKARGQAGQGAQQVQREAEHTTGRHSWRCAVCLDPAPHGWHYCLKCHAWDDFAHVFSGDSFRYRRARSYFKSRYPSESIEVLIAKLMRRLAVVENDLNFAVDERMAFNYAVDERMGCVETQIVRAIRPTVQFEERPALEPETVAEGAR